MLPGEILFLSLCLVYAAFSVLVGVKWLRVAQREHYIAGWTDKIARHWVSVRPTSWLPIVVAAVLGVASVYTPANLGWLTILLWSVALFASAWWPTGMGFRGRSSKLQWTPRARRLAGIWVFV